MLHRYLFEENDSAQSALVRAQSEECGELFKLASIGVLARMMLKGLKTAAWESNFESNELMVNATTPLVKWIESGNPQGVEMGRTIDAFFANINKALVDEIRKANSSGKLIKLNQNKRLPR